LKSNKTLLLLITLLVIQTSFGQQNKYPKDYFIFPLKPGQQNYLSGTLGELRGNHFHAGLDIKTFGQINWPIHACADGYITRIKISPWGYGRAIYVQHPSGHMTVYAHCQSFSKDIEKYVLEQQYEQKRYDVDLSLSNNLFRVKQNQVIAYSGNTGSSRGPHLHFEIRDAQQRALNPLGFGFKEIQDNVKPSFYKILLSTLSKNARVNNEFGTFTFKTKDKGGKRYITNQIQLQGTIGLAIKARDKLSGVNNPNAIAKIVVEQDGKEIFKYFNNDVLFHMQSYMNVHMSYDTYKKGGGKLHKCYVDDGDKLNKYETTSNKGKIIINDTLPHTLMIKIWDFYNNYSQLIIPIKGKKLHKGSLILNDKQKKITTELHKNILMVKCTNCPANSVLRLESSTRKTETKASYYKNNASVFLWDMRENFPRKIYLNDSLLDEHYIYPIPSAKKFTWFTKNATVSFNKNSLFDTLYLQMNTHNDTIDIGKHTIPLKKRISITMRSTATYNTTKTAMYKVYRGTASYIGGTWNGSKYTFSTKKFGKYALLTDTIPPTIKYIGKRRFTIKDRLSGIKSYNAYLNGEWILLKYDYRINRVVLAPKTKMSLSGEIKIEVVDNVGNKNTYTLDL